MPRRKDDERRLSPAKRVELQGKWEARQKGEDFRNAVDRVAQSAKVRRDEAMLRIDERWEKMLAAGEEIPKVQGINRIIGGLNGQARDLRASFRKLVEAARGRSADDATIRKWVAQHMLSAVSEIDPESVPDPEAATMLEWARENPDKFWMRTPKVAPVAKTATLDEEGVGVDRSVVDLLRTFTGANAN